MHNMLNGADEEVFGGFTLHKSQDQIVESAAHARTEDEMDDLIAESAESQLRSDAMSVALTWVDEGDFSYEALDALVEGTADVDEGEDLSDDEMDQFNDLMNGLVAAFVALGGDEANIDKALGGDDAACEKLGTRLSALLDEVTKSDDDLVAEFAVGGEMVMEGLKKVLRDGKTKWVRTNRRKRRMTPAQRAALKKARRRANTSAAKRSRSKTMRKRKSMGL